MLQFLRDDKRSNTCWLTLNLNGRKGISLPIVFGEKQRQRIEEALRGEWKFTTVGMVKRRCLVYALRIEEDRGADRRI